MTRWLRVLVLGCATSWMVPASATGSTGALQLAWLDGSGHLHATQWDAQGRALPDFDASQPMALGSLWKLVAYAQWLESGAPETPFHCTGRSREEVYCCAPGESLSRGMALVRSCGLYFDQTRVPWSLPAGAAMRQLPAALVRAMQQGQLGPTTTVPLREWLQWLAQWPAALREQAGHDLLGYWLQGAGRHMLGQVAGQLRLKTYTLEQAGGRRQAGGSGWTAQGLPLWFSSSGTSADVVPRLALRVLDSVREPSPEHSADLQESSAATAGTACVRVHFFTRYPLAGISPLARAASVTHGPLRGRYRLRFQNQQTLEIESRGELQLSGPPTQPRIDAELPLEDYVARVVDREGAAQPEQAAWALAVAARTHVLAHGRPSQGCLEIDDSSAAQRVAPRPATRGATHAAQATSGLLLSGGYTIAGMYHQSQGRDGVMSWRDAQRQAQEGANYLDILQTAYPRATLASAGSAGALACQPLALVQAWVERERPRWRRMLAGQPGFIDPGPIQVCHLSGGRNHANSGSRRIDVSGFATLEERLAVAHEFVHLGFAGHPRGRDENFVERQARQLLGVLQ